VFAGAVGLQLPALRITRDSFVVADLNLLAASLKAVTRPGARASRSRAGAANAGTSPNNAASSLSFTSPFSTTPGIKCHWPLEQTAETLKKSAGGLLHGPPRAQGPTQAVCAAHANTALPTRRERARNFPSTRLWRPCPWLTPRFPPGRIRLAVRLQSCAAPPCWLAGCGAQQGPPDQAGLWIDHTPNGERGAGLAGRRSCLPAMEQLFLVRVGEIEWPPSKLGSGSSPAKISSAALKPAGRWPGGPLASRTRSGGQTGAASRGSGLPRLAVGGVFSAASPEPTNLTQWG